MPRCPTSGLLCVEVRKQKRPALAAHLYPRPQSTCTPPSSISPVHPGSLIADVVSLCRDLSNGSWLSRTPRTSRPPERLARRPSSTYFAVCDATGAISALRGACDRISELNLHFHLCLGPSNILSRAVMTCYRSAAGILALKGLQFLVEIHSQRQALRASRLAVRSNGALALVRTCSAAVSLTQHCYLLA